MAFPQQWLPRSVTSLRTYSVRRFTHDLASGVTVGLVALPLAMAFGIASGVTPQAGLYTAVVAGFIISALGGSRVQIGGPTGAFVVIVAGIVAKFGMPGLAMVTVMAGIILLLMGLTGLGSTVRFIPRSVVIGFTNGIAVLIASTQIKDFFGLRTPAVPSEFLPRIKMLAAHYASFNPAALALGLGTLAILILLPRLTPAPVEGRLREAYAKLEGLSARLESVSHKAVLARGYAAVFSGDGHPVTAAAAVKPGAALRIDFADGSVRATAARDDKRQGALPL